MLQNSEDSIKYKFGQYLSNLDISPKSHKNYRSDLTHFTGWLILRVRSFGSYIESLTEAVPFLSSSVAKEYRSYMAQNKIPVKTINRRLSTLRHFAKCLTGSQILDIDFMNGVENLSAGTGKKTSLTPIVEDYRSYLEAQKVSKNTVKNYVGDIRQFLAWVESVNNRDSSITN
jgi:site-specific recombinase XerD